MFDHRGGVETSYSLVACAVVRWPGDHLCRVK